MAKPSITNIKPPSQTSVWTPPKTSWDLNVAADITAAGSDFALATDATAFNAAIARINLSEPSTLDLTTADLQGYEYVFFGVNGGENETVFVREYEAGIAVTGNGRDTINGAWTGDDGARHTGGSLLVFSGNGADSVAGSEYNDILFSENGPDTIRANDDSGTASLTIVPGGISGNAHFWNHDPRLDNDTDGTELPDHGARNYQAQQEGFWTDGAGHIWRVFSFANPSDTDQTITYAQSDQINGDGGVVASTFIAHGNHTTYFLVDDASLGDQGRIVIMFDDVDGEPPDLGDDVELQRNHIQLQISGDTLEFNWTAGDQLIGGNGPDRFVYDVADRTYANGTFNDGVDLIWDFNNGSGLGYNALEGDVLELHNITDANDDNLVSAADLTALTTWVNGQGEQVAEGDDGAVESLAISFGNDQAIVLVGITDISMVGLHFV